MSIAVQARWRKFIEAKRLTGEARALLGKARKRRPGPPILVSNLAQMGDIALCAGVAAALRERHPDSPLLFACPRPWRGIVADDPAFDGILSTQALYSVRALARSGLFARVYVLDIPIPTLLGYFRNVPSVFRYAPPTTGDWPCYKKNLMTFYEQNAGLPEGSAKPRVWVRPEDHDHAARLWRQEGLGQTAPVIALHTKSSLDSKTWPLERFAALVDRWYRDFGVRFVVVGGPGEAEELADRPGVIWLAGKLTLSQTAAIIARSDFFLGLDSGLAYFAEAMNTPGLVLLGATIQETSGPRAANFTFLRAPGACEPACHAICSRATLCITSLTDTLVDQALADAMRRTGVETFGPREAACASL